MSGFTLDWTAIRPLNGGREKGFEELCSQLARMEVSQGARFIRKGTPDAGVECYAVFADSTEWGWQSKYFDTLGESQWKQLDESVGAAIDKHPRLVRYYVCIPQDLSDGRIVGKKTGKQWKSSKDQWDEHVTKWSDWAQKKNRTIEFVWWGSSEMLERLARTENVGRVRFWFDKRGFDGSWFLARLDEAIRAAGPRYTPEIHVELPIAEDFDAFGRTQRFFNRVKAYAIPLREAFQRFLHSKSSVANDVTTAKIASLSEAFQIVFDEFGKISHFPAGPLPFQNIIGKLEKTAGRLKELELHLEQCVEEYDRQHLKEQSSLLQTKLNPFRELYYALFRLQRESENALEALTRADDLAKRTTFILRGNAGTGKTHLLCDAVRRRVEENQPTVLLMGQRFVSSDAPWFQVLQHLDLSILSAEEFVGALEASAQASGERALIAIDAINEGTGITIWPTHLAAFLAQIERSPWLGVVLSIRSSYEEIIVPTELRESAYLMTHHGFREHEYDAAKTFFVYYGLELPSTPLLAPEFQNPLFLKTLCRGLCEQGHQRLPRGFHGISTVFNLYLDAVNTRLAQQLGYDKRIPLVRRAVAAIADAMVDVNERWLHRERSCQVIDSLLPNRDFERSLFRGLVVEGVLVEDYYHSKGEIHHDVVHVVYERLADHLVAKAFLDRVTSPPDWIAAFSAGGALSPLMVEKYRTPGLLEALFIQFAERNDQELLTFAPQLKEQWGVGHAFRQSVIWRCNSAFSDATRQLLNDLCENDDDMFETLDVMLTVATIPEHPFNASFLDRRLRKDEMADRDEWWSTYLYRQWGNFGAVDRIIDWAWAVGSKAVITDDTIDLCGISLAWMLTTSHRYLRDRATKALVNLYTGRLQDMVRLVDRFADVDDPYVTERVYGVAYGIAMRSHDAAAVGCLAEVVYRHVFESGSPLPHILLRDYARGVVERAFHLGSQIKFDSSLIRPPYNSEWPYIPSDNETKPYLPDWSSGSHKSNDALWSRNAIGSSVMDSGDFSRYVIGTNSAVGSREYLSIRLDAPALIEQQSITEQLKALVNDLSSDELLAWQDYDLADRALGSAISTIAKKWFEEQEVTDIQTFSEHMDIEAVLDEFEKECSLEFMELEKARDDAENNLKMRLSKQHSARFNSIKSAEDNQPETARRPPRFPLDQVQRYILKRVFDLGWTVERFGHFDRFTVRNEGRAAQKPERIGKKYQWIAYHEIMAFLSDHYQYREEFSEVSGQGYQGPWQNDLRDIDTSCTLHTIPGGTSWDGHIAAWWGAEPYNSWGDASLLDDWITKFDDLPNVENLLICENPTDGSRWLNGYGYFNWKEKYPPDQPPSNEARGEIWYLTNAYLIRRCDTDAFLQWAETVDFMGRWMPEPCEVYQMFLGEHGWSPAAKYFQHFNYGDEGWRQPRDCPVQIRQVAVEYHKEGSGLDCSIDDGYTLLLPAEELISKIDLRWSGCGADFTTSSGQLAVQDPTAHSPGPTALLIRIEALLELQQKEDLTICWTVLGEKQIIASNFNGPEHPALCLSGAYVLDGVGLKGFVKRMVNDYINNEPIHISTYRTER